jgi:phosphopantetheinyl transferase (holo-ACP synthase)
MMEAVPQIDPIVSAVPGGPGRVLSFLGSAMIDEVERGWSHIAASCFAAGELSHLESRPLQTAAGFLATKRALLMLFEATEPRAELSERDFVLTHAENGAPRLVSVPDAGCYEHLGTAAIRISISHTKACAYGLACVQE